MHYLSMRDGERDEGEVGRRVFGGKGGEQERKKRKFFSVFLFNIPAVCRRVEICKSNSHLEENVTPQFP